MSKEFAVLDLSPVLKTLIYCIHFHYRHAALMAISAVGEGCQKHMEGMLPSIVEAVLHFISDPVN